MESKEPAVDIEKKSEKSDTEPVPTHYNTGKDDIHLLQQYHIYKTVAPLALEVVELDKKIQALILSESSPKIVSEDSIAVEDFEQALISSPQLLESAPQYDQCRPLLEQRKSIIAKIAEFGGDSKKSVSEMRKIAEWIRSKAEVEKMIKEGLCALEPSLQESDLIAMESLEASVALNEELLEKMPQYKGLIPLANQKNSLDLMLIESGLFPVQQVVSDKEKEDKQFLKLKLNGITYKKNWWGISVELTHEQFVAIFQTTNWMSTFTGALGAVLSGPGAIVMGVLTTFIKIYGTVVRNLERGNGMRFHIPWFAIYPMQSPLYVIPIPL